MILPTVLRRLHSLFWSKERKALEALFEAEKASIAGRTRVVRDGIEYVFSERTNGLTVVNATRRLKPYRRATFFVWDRSEAFAWQNDGVVANEEIREMLTRLQNGTWPEPSPVAVGD